MIFVITGLTASGKTALSLKWAQQLNAEIISVDSTLMYRGLNIGSDKPTLAERQGIPHYFIDHIEPEVTYSVAQFIEEVLPLIKKRTEAGENLILVGGSMLYFSALIHGMSNIPATPIALRQELEQRYQSESPITVHKQLQQIDAKNSRKITP